MKRLTKYEDDNVVLFDYDYEEMAEKFYNNNDVVDSVNLEFALEELAHYEDLKETGLIPRFHLGDEFWTIRLNRVVKSKIVMLQQKKDGTWRYRFSQEISPKYHDTHDYEECDYGEYFWTFEEEAEQKLVEMK